MIAGRPWHLWMIGLLGVAWNGFGAFDYIMTETRNAAYMAAFPPEQLAYFYGFPLWATAGWALGVWGGVAGALLLLLRSHWAVLAFAISLFGLAIATLYQMAAPVPASLRTAEALAMTGAIWLIALLLLWYALGMRGRGVLR